MHVIIERQDDGQKRLRIVASDSEDLFELGRLYEQLNTSCVEFVKTSVNSISIPLKGHKYE
jgi:hypothetical protein